MELYNNKMSMTDNENLYDYAEGYHAAINQISEELSSSELKAQVASYIDKLINKRHSVSNGN